MKVSGSGARGKNEKKKKSILLRVALIAFSIYVVIMMVQLQLELSASQKQLQDVNDKIAAQQRVNEDLETKNQNLDQYLEQEAREQGYAKPGEIIIYEIPGSEKK